jgi:hypothetical protein
MMPKDQLDMEIDQIMDDGEEEEWSQEHWNDDTEGAVSAVKEVKTPEGLSYKEELEWLAEKVGNEEVNGKRIKKQSDKQEYMNRVIQHTIIKGGLCTTSRSLRRIR